MWDHSELSLYTLLFFVNRKAVGVHAVSPCSGKARQIEITGVVKDVEANRRIKASVALAKISENDRREKNRNGPYRRMGKKVTEREQKRRHPIGGAETMPGGFSPTDLEPLALKKSAEKEFFSQRLQQGEGKKMPGKQFPGRDRTPQDISAQEDPEKNTRAQCGKEQRLLVKRGSAIQSHLMDYFTYWDPLRSSAGSRRCAFHLRYLDKVSDHTTTVFILSMKNAPPGKLAAHGVSYSTKTMRLLLDNFSLFS